MARLFSTFSHPTSSKGDSASGFLQNMVGESVSKIDSFVPPVIKQVSSEAISVAQGEVQPAGAGVLGTASGVLNTASGLIHQVSSDVATAVQPSGVLSSTASGFNIKQVSSDAVSAAPAGHVLSSTASGLIQQVSSDAVSAGSGVLNTASGLIHQVSSDVATAVHPSGVLSSTASGFIEQVSSDAISASPAGHVLSSAASGLIQQVSSDAVSAGAGVLNTASGLIHQVSSDVATAVQPSGVLMNTASGLIQHVLPAQGVATGFINQVASQAISAAQGVATGVLHTGEDKEEEEEEKLKYLAFVQVAVVHVVLFFTKLYVHVKERFGLLKPGIDIIEGIVKSLVQLVFAKYFDVPFQILKFLDNKVGELVTKMEGLVPSVLKQLSSEPISAAQNSQVQLHAGLLSNASGFIDQVSSEALSAAQNVPGVANVAADIQRAKEILEVIQRLRYYASIIINFYSNAKEKSGVLKPVVEIIEKLVVSMYKLVFEAMFKSLVGLVLEKYFGVPANLVDLVDGKVGESAVTNIDAIVPPVFKQEASGVVLGIATELQPTQVSSGVGFIKQISSDQVGASGFIKHVASEAISTAQKATDHEVEPTGLIKQVSSEAISTTTQKASGNNGVVISTTVSELVKQVSSEAISVAEDVATEIGVSTWRKLNKLPLVPQIASILVPTATYFTKKYNQAVVSTAEKGYKVASFLPLVPIDKIAKVFTEGNPKSHPLLFNRLFA